MELIFWLSAFLFVLNYFLYPGAVILLAKLVDDPHSMIQVPRDYQPKISLIIAAYNEAKVIRQKIENSLALDYPDGLLEIIVVSDGSDDDTHSIASEYSSRGVVALHEPARRGKSAAINRAAEKAKGEILLLSDANNDYSEDSAWILSRHFYDEKVGAVTGAKHVYPDDDREAARGDGAYWKYESAIKEAESRLGSITSGDGEIFAVRKSLFKPIDVKLINDDAAITFDLVKRNYRVLYDREAKSFEPASAELIDDFNVKLRMAAGGFQSISAEKRYLFFSFSWYAVRFLLHKVLRWLVPVLLILMFLSSLALVGQAHYLALFILQCMFYFISIYAWVNRKKKRLKSIVYLPMYFSVMNLAILLGMSRYLAGTQKVQWKKAER